MAQRRLGYCTNRMTTVRLQLDPRQRARHDNARPISANLEVERKFNVTALLRSHLDGTVTSQVQSPECPQANQGGLRFRKLPGKFINDQYFDRDDKFVSKGIWVRRRTERPLQIQDFPSRVKNIPETQWEAKVRLGGDYQNSEFEEVIGEEEVHALVRSYGSDIAKLCRIVDLDTFRESWTAKEDADVSPAITVVVDTCSAPSFAGSGPGHELVFNHLVGEVELTRDVTMSFNEDEDLEVKQSATAAMKTELERFMCRHAALFPTTPAPTGKLTAYFAWKKQVEDHLNEKL